MTENTKYQVNTTDKVANAYSNFRRMIKSNIARSAAILALMSAPANGGDFK